jgi:hypothetical protein
VRRYLPRFSSDMMRCPEAAARYRDIALLPDQGDIGRPVRCCVSKVMELR